MNKLLRPRFNNRILQAFDSGPAGNGLHVRAAAAGKQVEILIYDMIGDDGWGGGVTPASVVNALADAGGKPVVVRINSPGGNVFDGLAIYNSLRGYAGDLETMVDGIAASAASIIALGARRVTMGEQSMMMIHNASTLEFGDKRAMASMAATLGKLDGQLAAIYAGKTGKTVAAIGAMMDAETYMTGADALAGGFCDAVVQPPKAAGAKNAAAPPGQVVPAIVRALARLRAAEAASL